MKFLILLLAISSLQFNHLAVADDYVPEDELFIDVDSIIEEDTRNQVIDHRDPVSKAVGLVSYGSGYCTGTLITPRHVITNGHCISIGNGKGGYKLRSPKDMKFVPGKLNAQDPGLGTYTGIRIDTFMQWVSSGDQEYDVAVIKLDRPVPNVAPLRLQRNNKARGFSDFMLTINGYSSKKPFGTQWIGSGSFERLIGRQSFLHNIDTLPGTSGGIIRRRVGDMWIGVGIHRGSITFGGKETLNRAIIFSDVVFNSLLQWIKN